MKKLEEELKLAKWFGLSKIKHKGIWISVGYASFLLMLYKARLKFGGKKC